MSLLDQARADFDSLMSSGDTGFTSTVTLRSPGGQSAQLQAVFTDVGTGLDPSTGQTISAHVSTVVFSETELNRVGLGIPVAVEDRLSKPWLVTTTRRDGTTKTYKIAEPRRDRLLGAHTYVLVSWQQ